MQFRILLCLMLIFNFNAFAVESNATIKDNLFELKEYIDEANHRKPKKFNELLTIVYNDLESKIHEIEEQMGGKKTALTIKMHEEHQSIQKDIVLYKQATKKKAKGLRVYIVQKLEQLFRQIEAYDNKAKKE